MIVFLFLVACALGAVMFGPLGVAGCFGALFVVLMARRARRRAGHREITYTIPPIPGRPGHRGRKAVL